MTSPGKKVPPDLLEHNREAWNRESLGGESPWCIPVDDAVIEAARHGEWQVILTPTRSVPRSWFGELAGAGVLCLASGGGQQAPVLAAAGARVISFDASQEQLAKDARVAERHGLDLRTVCGDMAELGEFGNGSFDLIFHPVSNVFVPDVEVVWRECRRVLRPGGRLLAGFMNPDYFLFDHLSIESGGPLEVTYELPFADVTHLDERRLQALVDQGQAFEFSHSLNAQIGGQITAGFVIEGFYEDRWSDAATALNRYMSTSMASLAIAR